MTEEKKGMTYKDAGVDIDAGNSLVERIKFLLGLTRKNSDTVVLGDLKGFSGCIELPEGPVLSMGTDGVGTKLKLAFALNKHDTVGIDLVAMCANDTVVNSSKPIAFLDYFATGKLSVDQASSVIAGIANGCQQAGCPLIGGETAEMPGFYGPGEYDLAGFCIGYLPAKECLITGSDITAGTRIFGLPSSGIHSNGYSLVRAILGIKDATKEEVRAVLETHVPQLGCTWGEELLKPTKIYVKPALNLVNHPEIDILGMAHITGGGLIDNPIRPLPDGLGININLDAWNMPPVFHVLREMGNVAQEEMLRTFNCGIGMLFFSDDDLCAYNQELIEIGEVIKSDEKKVFFTGTL